jgi:hypothetical protein
MIKDVDYVLMRDYEADTKDLTQTYANVIKLITSEKNDLQRMFFAVIGAVGEVRLSPEDLDSDITIEKTMDYRTNEIVFTPHRMKGERK